MSLVDVAKGKARLDGFSRLPWWKSLSFALLIYLLVVLLFTATLLLALVNGYMRPQLLQSENQLQRLTSEHIVFEVRDKLLAAQLLAQLMAKTIESSERVDPSTLERAASLLDAPMLKQLVAGGGIWPEPYQFDAKKERASLFLARQNDGKLSRLEDYNDPSNPPYWHEEWYVPASLLKSNSCYWSRTYVDPYSQEPMVTCSIPVHRQPDKLWGIVTVDLRLRGIRDLLHTLAANNSGYALILDRENRLLAKPQVSEQGSLPARVFETLQSESLVDAKVLQSFIPEFKPYAEVAESINQKYVVEKADLLSDQQQAKLNTALAVNRQQAALINVALSSAMIGDLRYQSTSIDTLQIDTDPFLRKPVVANIFVMPNTLWKLIIVSPQDYVFASADYMLTKISIYLLGIGIFILAVSYFAIRYRITRPLNQIIAQLNSDSSLPISIESEDELNIVAEHINRTTKELRASNKQLKTLVKKREKADKLRRMSEKRFRAIARTAPDAIISVKVNGEIIDWNPAATNIFGYNKSEILRTQFSRLFVVNDIKDKLNELTHYLKESAAELFLENIEIQAVRKSGELFPAELACTGWKTDKGRFFTLFVRDITERIKAQHALRHQALHDPLTQLPNRSLFNDRLGQAIRQAEREQHMVVVMILDLDNFKIINDTLGHRIGDALLREVTQKLSREQRASDTIARLGGDEFGIILSGIHHLNEAGHVAERYRSIVCQPLQIDKNTLQVGVSIGIAAYPIHGNNKEELLINADMAMYHSKACGRNTYSFFQPEMGEKIRKRKWLSEQMEVALRENQFDIYLQPIISLKTGQVVSAEALIRWVHPKHGFISPGEFIPIAEQSGFIKEITEFVIKRTCLYLTKMNHLFAREIPIAINVSASLIHQADFVDSLLRSVKRSKLKTHLIECEITETTAMQDVELAVKVFDDLHRNGFKLSIDDFGTGYSSLNYLKKFPISKLKIDRSFVVDLPEDEESASIARAVIELAHSLKAEVLAEGVETQQQNAWLKDAGCDLAQGYLHARPMPFADFVDWLQSFVPVVETSDTH